MWLYTLFSLISAVCYLIAARLTFSHLVHGTRTRSSTFIYLIVVASGLHLVSLAHGIGGAETQNLSMLNVASSLTWLIAFTLSFGLFHGATRGLIPVSYLMASLILVMAALLPDSHFIELSGHPGLIIHIGLAIIAYGAILVLLLYAGQFAYINYRLKHKQADLLTSTLPPLLQVENTLFRLLSLGTSLLFLSIVTGFIYLDDMFAQGQAHKTVLSLAALMIFIITLFGHKILGWRGKPVITSTMIGAGLLTLAYFGSRFVKEVILHQ